MKVQLQSRRPSIQGHALSARGHCVRIAVSEAPEDGQANKAASVEPAKALRVPASTMAVSIGQSSCNRTLHISGEVAGLAARLETL